MIQKTIEFKWIREGLERWTGPEVTLFFGVGVDAVQTMLAAAAVGTHGETVLARVTPAPVLTYRAASALLAPALHAVMLAYLRSATLFALVLFTVVVADA
jgi:hypothetical protein